MRAEGSRQSEYFAALPKEARELAMEFGREAREAYDAELREKQQKKAAAKAQEEQKKASVRFEGGVTEENAGERVKAARDALALVAEKSGVSFVITDEISNRENGHYDPKTNTIYLSPDAGKSGQRTILWTASHELVHAVKEAGVDDFNLLADTLMEAYGKKGVNIDALVAIEQEKAARAGAELSFQDAYEEVVAQAMQDFLTDSEQGFFRTMQNLEAKKPGIGEILLEAIQRILQRIAGIYNGMRPTDAAYACVGRMNEELGRMYEIMTRALTGEAAASQQSMKADTKKAASKEGGVKAPDSTKRYQLKEYSEKQRDNWKQSKRIEIYQNQEQLSNFISKAIADSTMNKKMYFGAISSDFAAEIQARTGIDVENYNLSLGANEIRKILKSHGNEATEASRGQRAIVKGDFEHILDVVLSPTSIRRESTNYEGKPVIVFSGQHNGTVTVVAVVSDKHLDLFVQTAYASAKKRDLATVIDGKSPYPTSEAARGTVSNSKIFDSSENVKPFSEKNSGKSQIREDAETDLAKDYAAPITAKDVEELRSIGRKSVSQFTSKDLQKAGKWAYKFYQELGTKSPFFRTWFGDWRANDLTKATVVKGTEAEYAGAGKIRNKDMNRSVSWGDVLKKETQVHSRKNDTVKFLGDIGDIVENAVLFDTVVSEASSKTKMPNTAFMHSLYSVYKTNGETYLLKLYVEEALPNRGGDPFSRAYELKTIEKIANLPNGVLSVSKGLTDGKSAISNLTVADLFSLVKQFDKDFSAGAAANPMFLNDNGTPKMFYHGSRTGGFTEFRSWQYFSEKKNYAQGYADRNNENSLYAVYLHADKIFDTRDAEARRIFYDIRQEYGLGELQEDTGLPDWTDGYDLSDYLEEHPELGYDAILLDEGGDMIDGKPVSRGESIVIKNSSQIKSATDNLGTFDRSNPDIRYQYKDSSETNAKDSDEKPKFRADYEALIQKPDMAVTRLSPGRLPESRAAVIDLARKNAAEIGRVDKNGGVSVFVADIGEDVYLSKSGLRHSLDRRFAVNAPVIAEAGEILANSIQINELNPRGDAHETIVLIGAAEGTNGEFYLVESVLNRQDMELETMEILYSMNAKKGTAVLNAPPATTPDYRSTITIADLLDVVNTNFPDVLPESVLRHFGHTERPAGRIGESALYQYRDYTSINERRALVAALEASAQTDSEKMALTEYRRNLGYLEQQEQKLVQLRREIRELSFAKGKRDMAKIQSLREEAMLTSNRIDTADKAMLRGEKMAPIKRLLQSETAKAALAERQRAAATLREEKRAASKEQRELADRYRERMHRNVEGRKMTETKNKIKRAVSDLRSLMNAGKDRANVKIELRPAVQQALDTADVLFSNMSDAEVFRAGIHPVGEIEINAAKRYGEFLDRVERMQRELEALPEGSEAYKEKAKELTGSKKDVFHSEATSLAVRRVSLKNKSQCRLQWGRRLTFCFQNPS